MRKQLVTASTALLALSCLLHTGAAKADSFLLTGSTPATAYTPAITFSATVTGVADATVAGAFDLTGGSGTLNGVAVTLYNTAGATPGSIQSATFGSPDFTQSSFYEFDNVLYTSGNDGLALDEYGLLFSEADDHFNPFTQGPDYVYTNDETVNGFNAPLVSLTVTPISSTGVTPEPSSIALLGTGLLGTAGMLRRRFGA